MTDSDLIEFAKEFRDGILDDQMPTLMCFAVSAGRRHVATDRGRPGSVAPGYGAPRFNLSGSRSRL